MASDDLDVLEFAGVLSRLPSDAPITDEFDLALRGKVHPRGQKAHMCNWFASQTGTGSGQYTRSEPNRSARTAYNRLLSPGGILWINEALGRDTEVVQQAAKAGLEESDYRSRCRVIREHLPWEDIAELAQTKRASLYEADVKAAKERRRKLRAPSSRGSKKPDPAPETQTARQKPPKRRAKQVWPPLEREWR